MIFSQWRRENIITKRDAEVVLCETKLVKKKKKWVKKTISEHFLHWILRKIIFFKHEGATCQWRRLKTVFQFSRKIFIAVFMDTCTAVHVYSSHVQTGVTSGRNTFREGNAGAETHLGEEELHQNSTTSAPALSSSPRVGYIRYCWGAVEPACEKMLLRKKIFRRYWFQEREC